MRRLIALALVAAGCYDPSVVNGGLTCASDGECPIDYYCAGDRHCWKRGTGPTTSHGGHDLAGAGSDLANGGGNADLSSGPDLILRPAAPSGLMTTPASPSSNLHPLVLGNATAGTIVHVYANGSCSGQPVAQGSATDFAAGFATTVTANATTTFSATATDPGDGAVSDCSTSIDYSSDTLAPAAPVLTTTMPLSPSASVTTPLVLGGAEAGSTVTLFTDAACAGPGVAATGAAAQLASPGLQVTVGVNTSTTFYAHAVDAAGNVSPCSTGLTYVEDPSTPPVPTGIITTPPSPSNSVTTFQISGSSVAGSTVKVYTTSDCSGAPVASGTAVQFASGFSLTVAVNSINSFYVAATASTGRTGLCSGAIPYIEDQVPPSVAAALVSDGSSAGSDAQWQAATGSIAATWSGFVDSATGIASYDWNVSSTTSCSGDVVPTSSVGNVAAASSSSVALVNGGKYYNCVRAWDGAHNAGAWVHSDGVTIDTTAPDSTGAAVRDGVSTDVDWMSGTAAMDANWSGFSDAASGIDHYEYNISTAPTCSGNVSATVPLPAGTLAQHTALALAPGTKYFNCVRAFDVAGNHGAWIASNGVTVDDTPPAVGAAVVRDGSTQGSDLAFQKSLTSLASNWSGFTDGGSGIANYDWGFATVADCSTLIGSVSAVGTGGVYGAGSLSLTDATRFYGCVRAIDLAGNASPWVASNGVTVENAPPSASNAAVHDGVGFPPDLQFQKSATSLSGNWSGFGDAVGIVSYSWTVSTSGCTGNVATGATAGQSFTAGGLALSDGQVYFVCVTAFDGAGNSAGPVQSDGVTVDASGPVVGTVRDGAGGDVQFQKSLTGMSANWLGFSDAGSGIVGYNYALSTHADCSLPIVSQSIVSTSGSGSVTVSAALADGVKYYNCVQGIDAVNNSGAWAVSNGVTTDGDAPTGGAVHDGTSGELAWSTSGASMGVNWLGFSDGTGSGIVVYDWQLTTTSDCSGTPVAAVSGVGASQPGSFTATGLALADGTTYYNCIRADDAVGNLGPWVASNGVTTDLSQPAVASASVLDGSTAVDALWLNGVHGAGATWSGFSDGGSGIVSYNYNLSSTSGCTGDVYGGAGVNVGNVATYSFTNAGVTLTQSAGTTYFDCVQAVDVAGNKSDWVSSNGFHVDAVKPVVGTVNDGGGSDVAWWNSATQMSANWSGFSDALSGIQRYDWGLSSSASCAVIDLAGPVNESLSPSVSAAPTSTMSEGSTYYNCVRAVDNAGNVGDWKASSGVAIDVTPPVPNLVRDGSGTESPWSSSTTNDTLNWTLFTDARSGIASYDAFLASDSGCATLVGGFAQTGMSAATQNTTLAGSGLVDGKTYYNCVRAHDVAGNVSSYGISSGFTIDTDKPSTPAITSATPGNGQIAVAWSAATDVGSGVADYGVYACSGAACTPTFYQSTASLTLTVTGLANCSPATIQVYARDKAGNLSATPGSATATPTTPAPGPITVVPGAGRFEYSFASLGAGATYSVCWGATNSPSTGGTCISGSTQPGGFIEGQDASHLVPLNTAWLQARATVSGCASPWTAPQPINLYALGQLYNGVSTTQSGLGYNIANLGDVNGDGVGDFAFTTGPFGGACTHTVYVYSGASGTQLWSAQGHFLCGADDYFGNAIAGGADLDGDGANDVLIGALNDHDATAGDTAQGTWYLYSGKTGSLLCPNVGIAATNSGYLGSSVAFIRDVSGDGLPDILVSARGSQVSHVDGYAQVYKYDKAGNVCTKIATIGDPDTGSTNYNDLFGMGVAPLGDFDGDGTGDFAISAPELGTGGTIYVFSGATIATTPAQVTGSPLTVPGGYNVGGDSLVALGDVDGDGLPDLISSGGPANSIYSAVVFSGRSPGTALWKQKTSGSDHYGYDAGPLGDVNNDGYADFWVSANNATVNSVTGAGAIYLYSGKTGQQIYEIDGTVTNAQLGAAAGGGDINGDGHPDLVVGNYAISCGGNADCGEWWVYSPSSELGMKPAESSGPFFVNTTPLAAAMTLQATGGSGSMTWSLATNRSSGTLNSSTGAYAPGGIVDVLDTVSVSDALNREFDTRLWVRSNPGAAKPRVERPTSLKVGGVGGTGQVALQWTNPGTNPAGTAPLVAYRLPAGAWSVVALAAGQATYTFNGPPNTYYRFRVKEQASYGDSPWSNEILAATGP